MKALFYTATAAFIVFAGVIAYFALQTPASSVGGARVVIDIDTSGMPAVADDQANAPLDPYANEKDDQPEGTESAHAAGLAEPDAGSGAQAHSAIVDEGAPQSHAAGDTAGQQEDIPAPPPGTALAGLQQDGPLFREVAPDQPSSAAGGLTSDNAPAEPVPAAEPAFALPGTDIDLPLAEEAPERQALRGGADLSSDATGTAPAAETAPAEGLPALAADPAETQAIAATPPPPPPVRRPSSIPSPEARVAAADGGWGGVQYASTDVNASKEARVAILLRGVGRNEQESTDAIAKLPSAVSLGFLPYASAGRFASRAREKGHEIIVQVPLEPVDYPATNPGPDTLLTSLPPEQNAQRLETVLGRFEGHTGVTALLGSKMLQSKASLKPVLEELKARGLVYVGDSGRNSSAVRQLAREVNLRYGAAQVVIDAQATPEAIDKALSRLVALARQNGSAIGVGTAKSVTISQIQAWSQKLAAQGITLVPVGALAQSPGSS
jgi:polysaccharide deacetylase 2 family uncharacterized protein YibQ